MKDIKTLFSMIKQLGYILDRKQKRGAVGIFLVILLGSILEMIGISSLLPLIQSFIAPEQLLDKWYINILTSIFRVKNPFHLLIVLCICIALIFVIKNAVLAFSAYLQGAYKSRLLEYLSVQMLKSYMSRPYEFFVNTNSGEIIRGVTDDCSGVHDIMEKLFLFLSEFFVVLLLGGFLFYTDWIMAIGVICVGGVCALILLLGTKNRITYVSKSSREAIEENNQQVVQITAGIKEIYVTKTQESFLGKYKKSFEKRIDACIQYAFITALPERIIETVCIAGMMLVVIIRMLIGYDIQSFAASLAAFAVAAVRMMPSISRMTGHMAGFIFNRLPLEACYNNVKEARESGHYYTTLEVKETKTGIQDMTDAIVLENLEWQYNSSKTVLNGLNMRIEKGQAIGIIGESGAGKSTLSDILLGLYEPKEGSVTVDGVSIYQMPLKWSQMIGYVPQMVFLLDDTIRNNIIWGRNIKSDEEIWKILEMTNLKTYVEALPEQLDTIVGERGIKFSGGQRQRIAIARALYSEPSILILDEATSALDSETERVVMEAIDSLQKEKTLIIVAHRLSTLKNCDVIYEIKDGKAIVRDKSEILTGN